MDKTSICRLATTHLGIAPINDIDDDNPTANAFREVWDACRDDVFSEHRWSFADTQLLLELIDDTGTEVIGWNFVYGYPAKVARVWAVYNVVNTQKKEEVEFEKKFKVSEGRNLICTNEAQAYCDATYIVEDTTVWDAKFCFAFSLRIAAEVCPQLVGDTQKQEQLKNLYLQAIAEAKRVGFSEKKSKAHQSTGYIDARG